MEKHFAGKMFEKVIGTEEKRIQERHLVFCLTQLMTVKLSFELKNGQIRAQVPLTASETTDVPPPTLFDSVGVAYMALGWAWKPEFPMHSSDTELLA